MIKLILKLSIICSLVFSSISQAGPIASDLTEDSYITYEYDNVAYDIAWASSVNSERYYGFDGGKNILSNPNLHSGWDYATEEQLAFLNALALSGDLSTLLTRLDGSYIHAFEYWNDLYAAPTNTRDIDGGRVASEWVWNIAEDTTYEVDTIEQFTEILNRSGSSYDTFYFRTTLVPEPSTLFIFAIALIAIVGRKKLLNYF